MAEAAKADDSDPLARADLPVPQGRIGGDAGAEQRRHRLEIEVFGNLGDETLLDDDLFGISAEGQVLRTAFSVVIGQGAALGAILFEPGLAGLAAAARIDHAADGGEIAGLELRDMRPDLDHAADDLMARNHGIKRIAPVIARLMEVGMADAAIKDVDLDVMRAGIATLETERL